MVTANLYNLCVPLFTFKSLSPSTHLSDSFSPRLSGAHQMLPMIYTVADG